MSDAKRDQSAFRRTAAASQAVAPRARPAALATARPQPRTLKLQTLKLELLEVVQPWGSAAAVGGDPYNAVGPRATVKQARLCPPAVQKRAM